MNKGVQKNDGEKRGRGKYTFYFSLATLSIGVLVYIWLQPWAYFGTGGGLGIAIFPTVFVAILLFVSLTGALCEKRQREGSKRPTEEERLLFLPVIFLTGGVVAGTFGLWNFDPVISVAAVVLLLLLTGSVRDWRLLVSLPIGMGLLSYFLFIRMLGVYFPHGWFN